MPTRIIVIQLAHFIFNRWEPLKLRYVVPLLTAAPAIVSIILVPQIGIIRGVAYTFGGYWVALCTSILLYRLSPFHPMARYPGPLGAKISKLYMVWVVEQKRPYYLWFQEQHRKYGDVVRIGGVSVTHRELWHRLFIVPCRTFRSERNLRMQYRCHRTHVGYTGHTQGTKYAPGISFPLCALLMGVAAYSEGYPDKDGKKPEPSLIAFHDPVAHAHRRRRWNRAFSVAALKEYEQMFRQRATQLVETLSKQHGVIDLAQWISYFS